MRGDNRRFRRGGYRTGPLPARGRRRAPWSQLSRYTPMAAGQPKPAFYVALAVVVLGLVAFAYYRSDVVAPKPVEPQGGGGGAPQAGKIEPKDLGGLEQAAESTD